MLTRLLLRGQTLFSLVSRSLCHSKSIATGQIIDHGIALSFTSLLDFVIVCTCALEFFLGLQSNGLRTREYATGMQLSYSMRSSRFTDQCLRRLAMVHRVHRPLAIGGPSSKLLSSGRHKTTYLPLWLMVCYPSLPWIR